ncbi:PEX10 RING-finger-containing E3 ubiquitin ligase [Pyrenophora tritici-repentis]|uniref:RING-type E3 ubiquitin transferase n=2 Tax=Pyrenophora tritici-repentis TaxID=45151 RepID=A0A2W1EFY4_9PLEO|nr:peroxisome assembly protein 10 [Pyrenophora tritici-repentis Pt-1C-BFP]KAA8623199.1 Peroxisome assembly protein 10 [Pyrenophora tritici-repentis]EDU45259.1 peroxisome assembly protein 10 [Pyrenophora tritici-repentis Pt-1C-BFP]KAF7452196.1 Peroxisome assembly protein [Pyrenophora tritici-repentis]KAG9386539.1 Peroxisome assembly protein 10 [Pyrenophora tritici-repentis]KAI0619814.1 Peroxisome assembly protein 10 [Pyrenophora tritici-repentis]
MATSKAPAPFTYPFATSPDIIRSHQKDAYFSSLLTTHLSTLLRKARGARVAHTYNTETRVVGDLLYLALTTLLGNRTLGEEYTDIVQVEAETGRLPALGRRAGYILSFIVVPYLLGRGLPVFRRRVRGKLERGVGAYERDLGRKEQAAREAGKAGPVRRPLGMRLQSYLLKNLDTITSPAPIYAVSLATFYFSGSYYHLSKRLWGLRYMFTRQVPEGDNRAGYEVLGVLLVLQMGVQAYLHLHNTVTSTPGAVPQGTSAVVGGGAEVSLDPNAYTANNALLFEAAASAPQASASALQQWTHTPTMAKARYGLDDEDTMGWIGGANRKCTLCLEEMKDPSVTTCGHVFCWTCIGDWAREKPECPLCRQACLVQHVLPLRG